MKEVAIASLSEKDLEQIWQIGFRQEHPLWASLNAPYFEEYQSYSDTEAFKQDNQNWVNNGNQWGIFVGNTLVGTISRYWESEKTRWLEVGLVIYDEEQWSKGYGYLALEKWLEKCFEDFPDIARVGLTTWSGNKGMMRLAEKLGMQQEACLRKVRYWQGFYYDSIKYGVLRDEWDSRNS